MSIFFSENELKQYRLLNHMLSLCAEGLYCYYICDFLKDYKSSESASNNLQDWSVCICETFYDKVVSNWCALFGTDNEETHYSKLVLDEIIRNKLSEILKSSLNIRGKIRNKIFEAVAMNEMDYLKYWDNVVKYRNEYLVHRVHNPGKVVKGIIKYPKTLPMKRSLLYLYYLLVQIIKSYDGKKGIYQLDFIDCKSQNDIDTYYRKGFKKVKPILKNMAEQLLLKKK